jgi:peptidyl-tRNA hydrolase
MIVSRPAVAPLIACLFAVLAAPLAAQAPAAPPTTAVLVSLTVKPDIDRLQITKVMPDEVRETVKVYLDGKIQQWYARGDGRGVVFILNATTLADAKAVMESLPLWKAGFVNLEYTALGPLTPLRALIAPPGAGQGK